MANSKQNQAAPVAEQTPNKQEAFLVKYKKAVVGGIIALLVIVAAVIAFNTYYLVPREDKAATAISKAQELFASEQYEKALKGDKGVEGFLAVAENYSGTASGNLANLYAGLCYAKLDKWKDAVNSLEKFSTQDDALISPASQAALGDAYAHVNNLDEAVSCYKKAAKMADSESVDVNNSVSPIYLIKAARILESQKKTDDALAIYKEVKEKYQNSPAYQDIDKYIERLSK